MLPSPMFSRCCGWLQARDVIPGRVTRVSTSEARALRQAVDALREIFIAALLPDRKLRFFEEQPLARVPPGRAGERALMLFLLEDCLKRRCRPASPGALRSVKEKPS